MPIKGKQILDDSMNLKKLSTGIKILDPGSKMGVNKPTASFTDPNEYVTKQYVDDLSDDIDNETIIVDGGVLKVNIKNPVDSDEIAIIVDGTNGIHLNRSDISSTIISGNGLSETIDINGNKTIDVDTISLAGDGLLGTSGVFSVDLVNLSNTFLNKVDTTSQTVISNVTFQSDITFNSSALSTKTQFEFTNNQEFVSKLYVDSVAHGIDWKESALLATNIELSSGWTYNIDSFGSSTSGYLDTLVFSGTIIGSDIDTASTSGLTTGDRILVKNQSDLKQNGIYELTSVDTLTRASDHDGSPQSEISGGNAIFIEYGTYINTGWLLQGQGSLIPNIDDMNWTQFSGAGSIIAGAGLIKTGDTIDIELATNSGLKFDVGGAAGKLLIDAKTPASTDIAIQLIGGVHILKSDVSGTIINSTGLLSSVDGDGIKTLSVDLIGIAGNGLSSTSGQLIVNVDNSTIEIVSDILQLKANGVNNTHIDYGTAGNQVNASYIPTVNYNWLGSAISGDNIQNILQALDSDIQSIGGATTASNGLNKNINDIQLGGFLIQDTTINGDNGSHFLSFIGMEALTFNINNGGSFVMNATDNIFTDSTISQEGIKYAADYSANFVDRSLVDKQYVDNVFSNISATNGLTEYSEGTIGLGGTLTQNTTISGATGAYNLTINQIGTLNLATQSGFSLVMNGSAIFTDTANSKGLEYAADYSANFIDESLITKRYVDDQIDIHSTSSLSQWDTLEVTGFGVSGTSGQVSYLGSISFGNAIDEATVYINGVRLLVPTEAYFDTPGNTIPSFGSVLYFDLDQLQYDIEVDDEIMITYLLK